MQLRHNRKRQIIGLTSTYVRVCVCVCLFGHKHMCVKLLWLPTCEGLLFADVSFEAIILKNLLAFKFGFEKFYLLVRKEQELRVSKHHVQ